MKSKIKEFYLGQNKSSSDFDEDITLADVLKILNRNINFNEHTVSEQIELIYDRYGIAVSYIQLFEILIVKTLLVFKVIQDIEISPDELQALYNKLSSRTLGVLIRELKSNYVFTDEQEKELNDILQRRNFIVHEYFKGKEQSNYIQAGEEREKLFNEITKFIKDLLRVYGWLDKITAVARKKFKANIEKN
ncbi:MAG: hypothetical protein ABSB79_14770 [Syntrophales bacterium]